MMISDDTYAVYRAACDKADAWLHGIRGPHRGQYYSHIPMPNPPDYVRDVTNDIRAEVEEYELHRDRPMHLLAYVKPDNAMVHPRALWTGDEGTITIWTGLELGRYRVVRKPWRDRHGNLRCTIKATLPGIGTYQGQWCCDVQDCVRLRRTGVA